MSTAVASTVRTSTQAPVQLQRAARVLIGWMRPENAKASIAGPGVSPTAEHERTVAAAVAAVGARPAGLDQSGVVQPAIEDLAAHLELLRQNSASAAYFAEGWTVAIAELSRVCAVQPHIVTDDAIQRAADVDPNDWMSIAAVTLPIGSGSPVHGAYNGDKKAWVFSSANPNLRILGEAQGDAPGAKIFGFAVGAPSSFVQVASYNGRYLLRDGYHRAYGLLRRGITRAPVFVREFERFEDLRLPAGMLPQDSYLGTRPPTLNDYLDDTVSTNGAMLVTQKIVLIQALEVATLG
jgi:hypothetical protein